jgi:hypothetical protein
MVLYQTPSEVAAANRRTFAQTMGMLIKFIAGCGLGIFLMAIIIASFPDLQFERGAAAPGGPGLPAEAAVVIITVYFLTVTIHELGHLGGGALAGFRFVLLVVGPLLVARHERGLRLGYSGRPLFLGGFLSSAPTDDHRLGARVALMVAGGPLASFLQLLLIFLLASALQDRPIPVRVGSILMLLALYSLVMLLFSAWPGRVRGLMTDGARLLTGLRGGPQAERQVAICALSGASAAGERPRDRNPAWLQRAITHSDGSAEEASANFYVYFQALDMGEPERAAAYLDHTLSLWQKLSPLLRSTYYLEAAYFEARYGGDPATARAWLDLCKGGMLVDRHTRWRAEAAVLLAEGQAEAARDRAEQGLAAIGRTFDQGLAKAEADWLHEIIRLSQAPSAARHAGSDELSFQPFGYSQDRRQDSEGGEASIDA